MSPSPLPFKVCCIQSPEEAELAAAAGATFVGLVGEMPSGPGPIPDDDIRAIAAGAPDAVVPVLLTSRDTATGIVEHARATGVRSLQLVRHLSPAVRAEVRAALPGARLIQVLHVEGPESLGVVADLAVGADYLLLDSGRPGAPVSELGGTGRTHDWALSAEVVRRAPVPVLLAGGLRPENVGRAVAAVRPWGVDVCSGLRNSGGRLVRERLRAFARALDA